MHTDPILQYPYAASNHSELIRQAERERTAATVHPWHGPLIATLVTARIAVGGKVVRLGQLIQGAARMPAATTR